MIANIKKLEKYCTDYTKIENYDEALKSPLKYDLHHRREISENKSRKQLIEENLYYGRPPEELIFLEHGEHHRLHNMNISTETRKKKADAMKGKHMSAETRKRMSEAKKGEKNPMFGKPKSAETRQRMSEALKGEKCYMYGKPKSAETKQKLSDALKGEKNPMFGKHWHLENDRRIYTD